jgi:hypothetical protein
LFPASIVTADGWFNLRIGGRTSVAGKTGCATPGHGSNRAIRRNSTDAVVVAVRDKKIASPACRNPCGRIQLAAYGRTSIARETSRAVAGHSANDATRRDFADHVVKQVCNVHVASSVDSYPSGKVQLRANGQSTVAGVSRPACARETVQRSR